MAHTVVSGILPSDNGDKYFPYCFVAGELGSTELRAKGQVEMKYAEIRLRTIFKPMSPALRLQHCKTASSC